MDPSLAPVLPAVNRSPEERRLARIFRGLDAESRRTLLAFAEFLDQRGGEPASTSRHEHAPSPAEPVFEPRPAEETVVAAIKRLRRTYPMLDSGSLLNETSALMAAHVLQGRPAGEVIDELEALFSAHFDALRGGAV